MVKKLIYFLVFIVALTMVIKGNTINGYTGLSVMFVGLALMLTELYLYNRKYQ